jgi:hypothetical protein
MSVLSETLPDTLAITVSVKADMTHWYDVIEQLKRCDHMADCSCAFMADLIELTIDRRVDSLESQK